jgi:hypothetical protein
MKLDDGRVSMVTAGKGYTIKVTIVSMPSHEVPNHENGQSDDHSDRR